MKQTNDNKTSLDLDLKIHTESSIIWSSNQTCTAYETKDAVLGHWPYYSSCEEE